MEMANYKIRNEIQSPTMMENRGNHMETQESDQTTAKSILLHFLFPGILIMLTISLLLLLLPGGGEGATITVDDDGGADYTKIQDAIDNATEGDTIEVRDGTYKENLIINKSIELIGSGNETTIIDGGNSDDVIIIVTDGIHISNFFLTRSGGWPHAAIMVFSNNNEITSNNCSKNQGDGIRLNSTCENNLIKNNTCSDNYYGIRLQSSSDDNMVRGNTCINNIYGIWIYNSTNNTIIDNLCNYNGAGIGLWLSDDNYIIGNLCAYNDDFGISVKESSKIIFRENNCTENRKHGFFLNSQSDYCNLENNTLYKNDNGISISNSNSATVMNNTNYENSNYGISLYNSSYNIIVQNHCTNNFGGIRLRYTSDNNNLRENTLNENKIGLFLSDFSNYNFFNFNLISNNNIYGLEADDNNGFTINATNNYWGDPSGPHHPENNSDGKGDNVTDYVIFDPWLTAPYTPPVAFIDSITPSPGLVSESVTFTAYGEASADITTYSWSSSIDGELYTGPNSSFVITPDPDTTRSSPAPPPTNLSLGTHTISLKVQDSAGIWSEEVTETLIVHRRPTVRITNIGPNPIDFGDYISFVSVGEDDGYVAYYKWTSSIDGVLFDKPGSGFLNDNLSIGNHTITLVVQDNLGAWSEEVTATVEVREVINPNTNNLPEVSYYKPKNNSVVSGLVSVGGSAEDKDGWIEDVEVSVDDGPWIRANGTSSWNYKFDSTPLPDGPHSILIRSYDGTDYSNITIIRITVKNTDNGGNEEGDGGGGLIPGFGVEAIILSLTSLAYFSSLRKNLLSDK